MFALPLKLLIVKLFPQKNMVFVRKIYVERFDIMITHVCNSYPLAPHFYIEQVAQRAKRAITSLLGLLDAKGKLTPQSVVQSG